MKSTTPIKINNLTVGALICTFLWGSAYPCVKIGYEWFGIANADTGAKLLFAGLRFFIAGLITLSVTWMLQKETILPKKQEWAGIVILGIVQTTIQYLFFYIGLSNTTGTTGAILQSSGTFFAVIIAHFCFKDDRLNKYKAFGCIFGVIGVVVINLRLQGNQGGISELVQFNLLGEGFMLFAGISFAIGSVISKIVTRKSNAMLVTGLQLTMGGGLLTFIGLMLGGRFDQVDFKGILLLVYMSLLSAVAFSLWTTLIKLYGVGTVSIYNALVPLFGTVLSGLFLKENIFNIQNIVVLASVCTGIYLVNYRN